MRLPRPSLGFRTLASGAALALGSVLPAQIVTDTFDYTVGSGLAAMNGGTGFTGSWAAVVDPNSSPTLDSAGTVVANASPLAPGAGPYLSAAVSTNVATRPIGIYRTLGSASLATLGTESFTISFLWRPDSLANFSTSNDRFEMYSAAAANPWGAQVGSPAVASATSPFLMGVFGADRGANNAAARIFTAYNPSAAGNMTFSGDRYFDVGLDPDGSGPGTGSGGTLTAIENTVYAIAITLHPSTQKWDVSVSDGTSTVWSQGLNWWGTAVQPILAFGARGDQANELRSFSVDSVTVIPEPSTIALLAVPFALLVALRRRR